MAIVFYCSVIHGSGFFICLIYINIYIYNSICGKQCLLCLLHLEKNGANIVSEVTCNSLPVNLYLRFRPNGKFFLIFCRPVRNCCKKFEVSSKMYESYYREKSDGQNKKCRPGPVGLQAVYALGPIRNI